MPGTDAGGLTASCFYCQQMNVLIATGSEADVIGCAHCGREMGLNGDLRRKSERAAAIGLDRASLFAAPMRKPLLERLVRRR